MDQANTLIKRTLCLCELMHEHNGVFIFEHPEDPGDPFPSVFATQEMLDLIQKTNAQSVSLCQCRYGAPSKKPTRLVGTAEGLLDLCLMCNHESHQSILKGIDSESSSRRQPNLTLHPLTRH